MNNRIEINGKWYRVVPENQELFDADKLNALRGFVEYVAKFYGGMPPISQSTERGVIADTARRAKELLEWIG